MPRLVMKFGGTSVADLERIRNVARHVKREVDAGYQVAVVVSAMAGKTNELVGWCREASMIHDAREYDAVVASGEQVTSGLLAITLQSMGIPARSWQGWQIPIETSGAHGAARIEAIDGSRISRHFDERNEVAVVAGFQGVHAPTGRIATRARRLGYQRRGACRRPWRGALRHLYRCGRRLHDRSAHRGKSPPARPGLL